LTQAPNRSLNLVTELATLRSQALAQSTFAKERGKKFDAAVRKNCKIRLELAGESGGVVDSIYTKGRLSAMLTIHIDRETLPGTVFSHLSLDCRHGKQGYRDLKELISRNRHLFDQETVCFTLASRPQFRSLLSKIGFGMDSVILDGPVHEGLACLISKMDPPKNLKHLGLTIRKIKSAREVDGAVRILKKEFTRNPQFGLWVAKPKSISCIRANLKSLLASRKLDGYIICREETIVGFFAFHRAPEGPVFPAVAGIEIALDQEIQGLGIAKTCYRIMLEKMNRSGVKVIRGGTAQPAVLALGKILKRKPFAFMMRNAPAFFDRKHFQSYL
jgi:hypothetical protein